MAAKTPISILQEMMTKMGCPPKYDLIYDGTGTHTAVFKFKVYADDVTAIGTGRSKKEAKHEAARIALERFRARQIEDVKPAGTPSEPVELLSPYQDKLQENAIGALHDMCAANDIPMPEYRLVEEQGAPHDKMFTFVCSVSKQKEIGIGRTKKQAKQLAAYNMMNRLKESLGVVLKDIQEDPFENPISESLERAAAKYATLTPRKQVKLNRTPSKSYEYFSEISTECKDAAWNILKDMKITLESVDEDLKTILNSVLQSLEVKQTFRQGTKLKTGDVSVLLQLHLSTDAVFFGSGADSDKALHVASYNALVFLQVMLREGKEEDTKDNGSCLDTISNKIQLL